MIASDIHGSAYYCQKLLDAYKQEKADKLLLLGDLLYHGPRNDLPKEYNPKEVIVMLNSIKNEILCVRGNCEAEVDQMVLEFPVMADYIMLYVEGLTIFATHGHLYHENNLPPLKKGDVLMHGHTHISGIRDLGDITLVNPGSVSIPKENTNHSYMILEHGKFVLHNLE
jgi:putative phosphoesterase